MLSVTGWRVCMKGLGDMGLLILNYVQLSPNDKFVFGLQMLQNFGVI